MTLTASVCVRACQGRKPNWVLSPVGVVPSSAFVVINGELKIGTELAADAKGQVLDVACRLVRKHGRAVISWLMCETQLVVFQTQPDETVLEYPTLEWALTAAVPAAVDSTDPPVPAMAVAALRWVWSYAQSPKLLGNTGFCVGHQIAAKSACSVTALYRVLETDASDTAAGAGAGAGAGAAAPAAAAEAVAAKAAATHTTRPGPAKANTVGSTSSTWVHIQTPLAAVIARALSTDITANPANRAVLKTVANDIK